MDPITVATRRFLRDLERHWKRRPASLARLLAQASDRKHVIKALRLGENDPANRRPLFLYEAEFNDTGTYFAGLCDSALTDYDLVRNGVLEEGVTLASLDMTSRDSAVSPEAHAAAMLGAVSERLASHLDGALVALVPQAVTDAAEWRKSIERLARAARHPSLRIAVFDPDEGSLAGVLGPHGARFSFNMEELFDFAEQQTNRTSAGPPAPASPTLSPAQRDAFERSSGRKMPKPETAAELQALFMKGARVAAKNDWKAAAGAYRRARDLCHDEGLGVEEAAAAFALGGAYLAAGARPMAQAIYSQAALLAAQEQLWSISCQAKLGEAGVGWMERDFSRAAHAYAEAAGLAERGAIVPLRIEALRMEGICHQQRGAETEAIQAWRRALDVGTAAEEPERRASTFPEVVTAFAGLLEQRGLRPQAAHLRSLLDTPSPQARHPIKT